MTDVTRPVSLDVSIGGFCTSDYQVTMVNDVLEYRGWDCLSEPIQASIIPTEARWKAFRSKLDKMDVWSWRKRYKSKFIILDGTQWDLELRYPDRVIRSSGSNEYPENFDAFLRAVRALIGGLEFR